MATSLADPVLDVEPFTILSSDQLDHIRKSNQQLRSRIVELSEVVEDTSDVVTSLYSQCGRQENLLRAINRIPAHLLTDIWILLRDSDEDFRLNPRMFWALALAHVSHAWRELSFSTPTLWNCINIENIEHLAYEAKNGSDCDDYAKALAWLIPKSSGAPLDVILRLEGASPEFWEGPLALVMAEVQHWRRATLDLGGSTLFKLEFFNRLKTFGSAESLKVLKLELPPFQISTGDISLGSESLEIDFFRDAFNLIEVQIASAMQLSIDICWQNVERGSLHDYRRLIPGRNLLKDFLSKSSKLKHATIVFRHNAWTSGTVTNASLQSLILECQSPADIMAVKNLILPDLKAFHVRGFNFDINSLDILHAFLPRCDLTSISLSLDLPPLEEARTDFNRTLDNAVIMNVPLLKHLSLSLQTEDRNTANGGPINCLTVSSEAAVVSLPKLRNLDYGVNGDFYCHPGDTEEKQCSLLESEAIEAIESRMISKDVPALETLSLTFGTFNSGIRPSFDALKKFEKQGLRLSIFVKYMYVSGSPSQYRYKTGEGESTDIL